MFALVHDPQSRASILERTWMTRSLNLLSMRKNAPARHGRSVVMLAARTSSLDAVPSLQSLYPPLTRNQRNRQFRRKFKTLPRAYWAATRKCCCMAI